MSKAKIVTFDTISPEGLKVFKQISPNWAKITETTYIAYTTRLCADLRDILFPFCKVLCVFELSGEDSWSSHGCSPEVNSWLHKHI